MNRKKKHSVLLSTSVFHHLPTYKCIDLQRKKTHYLVTRYVAQGYKTWNCICSIPLPSWNCEKNLRYYFYGTLNLSSYVATILSPFRSIFTKCASQIAPVTALLSRLMTSTIENGRNNLLLSCTVIKSSLNTELTLTNIDFCDFQLK